jgi:hypothetical protein
MKWIPHAEPVLLIVDDGGEELERHALGDFDESRMNALLKSKGFARR